MINQLDCHICGKEMKLQHSEPLTVTWQQKLYWFPKFKLSLIDIILDTKWKRKARYDALAQFLDARGEWVEYSSKFTSEDFHCTEKIFT